MKNGWRQKAERHQYLQKLILTVLVMICLPVVLIQCFTVRRGYQQAREESVRRSEESSARFSEYLNLSIAQTAGHAYRIRTDRQIVVSDVMIQPYSQVEAIKKIDGYAAMVPFAARIGFYFRNSDMVLTSTYGYTMQQYLNTLSNETAFTDQVSEVLENGWTRDYSLISSFGCEPVERARLIIARPLKLGIDSRNNVMLFYELSAASLASSLSGQINSDEFSLAILDRGALQYSSAKFDGTLLTNDQFQAFLENEKGTRFSYEADGIEQSVFRTRNRLLDMDFITLIPQDVVTRSADKSYRVMWLMIVLLCAVLLVSAALTVYITYRPVSRLVQKISKELPDGGGQSEFAAISGTIEEIQNQRDTISEQRMLLMDNIIGNLMYGFSMSDRARAQLNQHFAGKDFFVIAASDFHFSTRENGLVEETLRRLLSIEVFITDVPFEKHLILICAKDPDQTCDGLVSKAGDILAQVLQRKVALGYGAVVADIEDLRSSYLSAVAELENKIESDKSKKISLTGGGGFTGNNRYDEEVQRFLQCVQNGFEGEALAQLGQIFTDWIDSAPNFPEAVYLCRKLANSYIAQLHKMGVEPERTTYLSLISFNTPDALRARLEKHIGSACSGVAERRKDSDDQLKQRMLEYVDGHFTEPDLTLMTVSDQCGISIYLCSRLFKEYAGIGFKDYVREKRMELAKEYLLTTDKSIAQVAKESGFENPTYFMTRFKALYGVSPSKFRQGNEAP